MIGLLEHTYYTNLSSITLLFYIYNHFETQWCTVYMSEVKKNWVKIKTGWLLVWVVVEKNVGETFRNWSVWIATDTGCNRNYISRNTRWTTQLHQRVQDARIKDHRCKNVPEKNKKTLKNVKNVTKIKNVCKRWIKNVDVFQPTFRHFVWLGILTSLAYLGFCKGRCMAQMAQWKIR